MTRSDENQIAARILWAATNHPAYTDKTPQERATLAGKARALEYFAAAISPSERAEMGRLGALKRWGNATLGIMPAKSQNADMNQVAARILGEATGELPKTNPAPAELSPKARAGRMGGTKGGAARAAILSPEQRAEIARKAAQARWGKR